jgi:hypothetical protein
VNATESESMTNTQFKEMMAELGAIRAVLERSAALAESLAVPVPSPADAFGPRDPVTGDPTPSRVHVNGTQGGPKKRGRK